MKIMKPAKVEAEVTERDEDNDKDVQEDNDNEVEVVARFNKVEVVEVVEAVEEVKRRASTRHVESKGKCTTRDFFQFFFSFLYISDLCSPHSQWTSRQLLRARRTNTSPTSSTCIGSLSVTCGS